MINENKDNLNDVYTLITLKDYSKIGRKKLHSYKFCGAEYFSDSFTDMLVNIVRIVDYNDHVILDVLADGKILKEKHFRRNTSGMYYPEKIRDGIFIDVNLTPKAVMKLIGDILSIYKVDKSEFSILVSD